MIVEYCEYSPRDILSPGGKFVKKVIIRGRLFKRKNRPLIKNYCYLKLLGAVSGTHHVDLKRMAKQDKVHLAVTHREHACL